jgi:hypothetical protein
MAVVGACRALWRLRLFVTLGFALAVALGSALTYEISLGVPPRFESRQYHVGVASASVLVDSPSSQVADLGDPQVAAGPGVLSARAELLVNLLATSPLKEQIAELAGISPTLLITQVGSSDPAQKVATTESPGVTVKPTDPEANVLRLTLNDTVPIITFNAQSPTPASAARLSGAAVTELERYLAQAAASEKVPHPRTLVIKRLGKAQASSQTRGHGPLLAAIVMIVLFGVWCVVLLSIDAMARRWRQSIEDDRSAVAPPADVLRIAGATEVAGPAGDDIPSRRRAAPRSLAGARSPERPEQSTQRRSSAGQSSADLIDWSESPERPKPGTQARRATR